MFKDVDERCADSQRYEGRDKLHKKVKKSYLLENIMELSRTFDNSIVASF